MCLCLCVSCTLASLECVQTVLLFGDPGPHMLKSITPGGSHHLTGIACSSPEAPRGQASQSSSLAFCFCSTSVAFDLSASYPGSSAALGRKWQNLPPPDSTSTHRFLPPSSARVNTVQLGAVLWMATDRKADFLLGLPLLPDKLYL